MIVVCVPRLFSTFGMLLNLGLYQLEIAVLVCEVEFLYVCIKLFTHKLQTEQEIFLNSAWLSVNIQSINLFWIREVMQVQVCLLDECIQA